MKRQRYHDQELYEREASLILVYFVQPSGKPVRHKVLLFSRRRLLPGCRRIATLLSSLPFSFSSRNLLIGIQNYLCLLQPYLEIGETGTLPKEFFEGLVESLRERRRRTFLKSGL